MTSATVPRDLERALFAAGCLVSLVTSSGVIGTFALSQQHRRHPAALVVSRSVCDLLLAVLWLSQLAMWYDDDDMSQYCSTSIFGLAAAFSTQFLLIASELLLACLAFDVLVYADDPFVDYRRNLVKYFALSSAVALVLACALVTHAGGESVGESFLPICWTKYKGGRVISYSNVAMTVFFYIPWFLCFLLSCAALGRTADVLGRRRQKKKGAAHSIDEEDAAATTTTTSAREAADDDDDDGNACTSALCDSQRVILFHASYWGLLLVFFGPLTNYSGGDRSDELDHALRSVVYLITGARAVENAAIWFRGTSVRGQADLSPLLNLSMQRQVLAAAVSGMSQLLASQQAVAAAADDVDDAAYVLPPPKSAAPTADSSSSSSSHERRYVLLSVLPILLACASSGVIAIMDDAEPSYVSIVFLAIFCAIALVLALAMNIFAIFPSPPSPSPHLAVSFSRLGEDAGFRQLREIWVTPAQSIADALRECDAARTTFSISAGKSGAFMFFTPDGRFVIKTIARAEYHVLCDRILPRLVEHASSSSAVTSLAKVFACFRMSFCYVNKRELYLVVMENVVHTSSSHGTRYDLKGSWLARTQQAPKRNTVCICQFCHRAFQYSSTAPTWSDRVCSLAATQGGPHRPRMLFKDNDFRDRILGRSDLTRAIRAQISRDTLFLCQLSLMDYSLLISVQRKLMVLHGDGVTGVNTTDRLLVASLLEFPSALRFGIVDWFTEYSLSKRAEFAYKYYVRCLQERDARGFLGFSSIAPDEYRERFMARVVDVVFPVLTNVVQVVVVTRAGGDEQQQEEEESTVALDVTGVRSLAQLNALVRSAVPLHRYQQQLVCVHQDLADGAFVIGDEAGLQRFLVCAQTHELVTLMISPPAAQEEDDGV